MIRDAGLVKAAHQLIQAQHELGRQHGGLDDQQAKLAELEAKLGDEQSGVQTIPGDLTRDIEKLNEELRTSCKYEELRDMQAVLAKLQAELADQQAHIGDQEGKLSEEKAHRGDEAGLRLKKLIDEAFQKGLVEPAPR